VIFNEKKRQKQFDKDIKKDFSVFEIILHFKKPQIQVTNATNQTKDAKRNSGV